MDCIDSFRISITYRSLLLCHVQRRGQRKGSGGSKFTKSLKRRDEPGSRSRATLEVHVLHPGQLEVFWNQGGGVYLFGSACFDVCGHNNGFMTRNKKPIEPLDYPEEVVSAGSHAEPGVVYLQCEHDWPSGSGRGEKKKIKNSFDMCCQERNRRRPLVTFQ